MWYWVPRWYGVMPTVHFSMFTFYVWSATEAGFFGHKKESTFMKYVQVQRPIDTNKIIDIFGGNLKKVS